MKAAGAETRRGRVAGEDQGLCLEHCDWEGSGRETSPAKTSGHEERVTLGRPAKCLRWRK